MRKLLEVFTTSYNEPKTIKKLIDFYRQRVPDCAITVFDNESTDGGETERICVEHNVTFRTFNTNGKMDEAALIMLRNNSWKISDSRFAIVCDSDELVDVAEEDLLVCNDGEWWNVCHCQGVELFGTKDDNPDEFWGVDSVGYSKSVLFHIPSIESMNFAPGSHQCNPTTKNGLPLKWSPNRFKLYHTKWQNWDEGLSRQKEIKEKGITEHSKKLGWNFHYSLPDSAHEEYFSKAYAQRRRYL